MRVLNRLDVTGSFGLGSQEKDTFVIGSPDLENNSISTDSLKVWANTEFKNNVTLGSDNTDTIYISGTLKNNGDASLTGSFSGSGENLTNIPNSGLQNYQINLNGSNVALGATASVGTIREITGGSNVTIGLVNATTRSVSLNDDINLTSVTASFSGNGSQINNLTASNINNFSADIRKQLSGLGVISYNPVTGEISYTGAGGSIYTGGNITGSGTSGDPIGIRPDPTFNEVTASYFTGSSAKLNYIDFVANTPAFNVGRLHYDTDDEILKFDLPYENTELSIGKQLIAKVKNVTGQTINKGKVVYVNGAQAASEVLYVTTASWENDANSANTIGLTMSELADQDIGYIILEGILEGISTTGYAAGALLYLSSSGDFTATKPTQPNHAVRLGHVAREQDNNGSIFVRIQNGFELDELHDVLITSPQNYDLLIRDTDGLWKNSKTLAGNYTFSGNNQFTGSLNGTASYASNADTLDGIDSISFARLDAINTFSAASNIFNNDVTINGTASIAQLNTVNQQSLNVGDKYITILSGSSTHVQMDGAGILFGSGSTDETTGDQNSVAHIVYRKGNAPSDYTSDYIEVYPQLRSAGAISGSGTLQAGGQSTFGAGVKIAYAAKTGNYSLTASSDYVVSFSGSNLTGTLPSAANIQGSVLVCKNLHTSSLFISASAGTIDGSTTGVYINGRYTSYTFLSDNTNWLII